MFGRISYTWQLMGASWDVLKQDKRLLLFPLLSGVCCLLVLASFAIPIFMADAWHPPGGAADAIHNVIYYATLFAYYFVNYLVITFFNVAMVACAIERMRGGAPDLRFGFNEAMARLSLIVGWALLSATVGLILRILEDRSAWLGKVVAAILGIAWGIGSYLVVPVLVVERKGPFAAFKDSAALFKKTWGQRIVGSFSFGAATFLFGIPGIAVVLVGVYLGMFARNWPLGIPCIAIGACYLLALALIQSALQSIFQAALYLYATGSTAEVATAPQGFPVQLLQQAMVAK